VQLLTVSDYTVGGVAYSG